MNLILFIQIHEVVDNFFQNLTLRDRNVLWSYAFLYRRVHHHILNTQQQNNLLRYGSKTLPTPKQRLKNISQCNIKEHRTINEIYLVIFTKKSPPLKLTSKCYHNAPDTAASRPPRNIHKGLHCIKG